MDDWMDGLDFDTGDSFDTDWFSDSGFEVDDIDVGDIDTGYDWDIAEGDSGSNWFSNLFGTTTNEQTGQQQINPWMAMLMSGFSNYQGQRNNEQAQRRGFEHDTAMAILRDQLQNKEWDRRQGLLSDAYKGYEQYGANTPGDMSGLSAYKPKSLLQGSGYYGY